MLNLDNLFVGNLVFTDDTVGGRAEFSRVNADRQAHRLTGVVAQVSVLVAGLAIVSQSLEPDDVFTVGRDLALVQSPQAQRLAILDGHARNLGPKAASVSVDLLSLGLVVNLLGTWTGSNGLVRDLPCGGEVVAKEIVGRHQSLAVVVESIHGIVSRKGRSRIKVRHLEIEEISRRIQVFTAIQPAQNHFPNVLAGRVASLPQRVGQPRDDAFQFLRRRLPFVLRWHLRQIECVEDLLVGLRIRNLANLSLAADRSVDPPFASARRDTSDNRSSGTGPVVAPPPWPRYPRR